MPLPTSLNALDDDVLGLICAALGVSQNHKTKNSQAEKPKPHLDALSLTCKRLRGHCLPYLFHTFNLYCYENNPWDRALEKLNAWNTNFSPFVREILVHLELGYMEDPEPFSDALPDVLAQTLSEISTSSPRLDKITVIINEDRAHLFERSFLKHVVLFPTVRRVVVSPYNDYLVSHCPNAEIVSVNDWVWLHSQKAATTREHSFNLMKRVATLKGLKCFVMKEWWTEELLEALHEAIPNIKTLIIPCSIAMSFETYVSCMSRFRHVEVLSIPSSADLRVGFSPPRCGNAYMGPGGDEVRKRVDEQRKQAEEHVASTLFQRIPSLKELWFDIYTKATMEENSSELGKRKRELQWSYGNPGKKWV